MISLHQLLKTMIEQGASDLHLTTGSPPQIRIDGGLRPLDLPPLTPPEGKRLCYSVLTEAQKHRFEEENELDLSFGVKDLSRFRANIFMQRGSVAGAFRAIPFKIFTFEELGLPLVVNDIANKPRGLVLVTGPTGSGKTTTLYSTLKQLATEEVNVCSVEDPIEMVEPAFNQMQVQQNIDLTFSDGIRTLLRQDPDIIMVGEIRDGETAEMATQAALTGHLVLSTLHTNDAPSSITRLLDLDVPFYLINSTVIGIMAQRLVRTLCPHCKEATDIDQATWDALVSPWKIAKPNQIQKAVGCLECRMTGYRGRSGIYEMLTISPAIKKLIAQNADLAAIRATAHREGMVPLMINGAEKVAAGITTIEELLKVAPSPLD